MADDSFLGGLLRGEMAADNFFIMTNAAGRDPELHLADRGLLADMISHKDGFVITEESLAARCKDGVKTIRQCLKRLRAQGYVYRGERMRYPAGSRNKAGKDISGALGPYRWYVTDKPEEIANILKQYAREQRALNLAAEHIPAVQDYRPEWEVVPNCDDENPVDNSDLGADLEAERAGSRDQAEHRESADQHNRPVTTVLKGRTKEDQPQEDQVEEQGGLACGSDTGRAALGRTEEPSSATGVGGSLEPEFVGQPQTAREAFDALRPESGVPTSGATSENTRVDPKRWHGVGGMVGDNSPAAQNARNSIVSGKRAPSWNDTRRAREQRDPAARQRVRAELAQRPAGLPRAAGLPLLDEQGHSGIAPPDSFPR
jgi:hypothetical protein